MRGRLAAVAARQAPLRRLPRPARRGAGPQEHVKNNPVCGTGVIDVEQQASCISTGGISAMQGERVASVSSVVTIRTLYI